MATLVADAQERHGTLAPLTAVLAAALVTGCGSSSSGASSSRVPDNDPAAKPAYEAPALARQPAAGAQLHAAQLAGQAGEHVPVPRQGCAADVHLLALPGHLPADRRQPALGAPAAGARRQEGAGGGGLGRPEGRHRQGRQPVHLEPRHDRADGVPRSAPSGSSTGRGRSTASRSAARPTAARSTTRRASTASPARAPRSRCTRRTSSPTGSSTTCRCWRPTERCAAGGSRSRCSPARRRARRRRGPERVGRQSPAPRAPACRPPSSPASP